MFAAPVHVPISGVLSLDDTVTLDHTLPMSAATLVLRCIGLCAAVCVLLLFFFPVLQGPFQATHGPTTDFRAKEASVFLLLAIVLAGHAVLSRVRLHGLHVLNHPEAGPISRTNSVPGPAVLRC